jgi:hypothetical protein
MIGPHHDGLYQVEMAPDLNEGFKKGASRFDPVETNY